MFNQYSRNLSANTDVEGEWFVCPLCHRVFPWEANSELSIEHIIPQALGGKIETLTCKQCNNEFGSKYLAKLAGNMKVWDKVKGNLNEPLDVKVLIKGKPITAEYFHGNPRKIILQPKRSNPENYKLFKGFREKGVPQFNMRLNLGYKPEYEQMAVLLISYLMLFKYFGYSYALNPWGLFTRDILINNRLDAPLLKMFGTPNETLIDGNTFLFFCTAPEEFSGYAGVQMRFSTAYSSRNFIKLVPFLPNAQFNEEMYSKTRSLTLSGQPVGFSPRYLTKPLFTVPQRLKINFEEQQ